MPTSPLWRATNSPRISVKAACAAGAMWASTPTHVTARIRVMIAAAIQRWRPLLAFSEDLKNVALEVEGMVGGEGGGVVAGLHEKLE